MVELTDAQIEILYDATDIHLKWYKVYYTSPPPYDVLLELNHTKLNYQIDEETTPEQITQILLKMKNLYQTLLDDYSNTSNYNYGE